jgi:hypothetical protein
VHAVSSLFPVLYLSNTKQTGKYNLPAPLSSLCCAMAVRCLRDDMHVTRLPVPGASPVRSLPGDQGAGCLIRS